MDDTIVEINVDGDKVWYAWDGETYHWNGPSALAAAVFHYSFNCAHLVRGYRVVDTEPSLQ